MNNDIERIKKIKTRVCEERGRRIFTKNVAVCAECAIKLLADAAAI